MGLVPILQTPNAADLVKNNYLTEMSSGSEAGSYLRLIDFVYHSTLGLRVMKKERSGPGRPSARQTCPGRRPTSAHQKENI